MFRFQFLLAGQTELQVINALRFRTFWVRQGYPLKIYFFLCVFVVKNCVFFFGELVKENFSDSVKYLKQGSSKCRCIMGCSLVSEIAQFVQELSRFPKLYNMSKTWLNILMDPTLGPIKTPSSFVLKSKKVSHFLWLKDFLQSCF